MEAIAVIGGASAVLTIAVEFGKMGERLCRLVKTLCHAQKEVQDISIEVLNFSKVLRILDETLSSANLTETTIGGPCAQKQLVQELIDQSRPLLKAFGQLREKLKPLRDNQSTTAVSRVIARLQWSRKKNSTLYLRRALDSHKITINLLISTIHLGETIARCKRCEEKGKSVPEYLKMKINALRRELRHAKQECKRAKEDVEHLRHQQQGAVDMLGSAEHFMRTVMKFADQQQKADRQQRAQQGSIVSSGDNWFPEQSNPSTISRAEKSYASQLGGTKAGMEIINIGHQSSSPSIVRELSPPAPTQRQRPAGSVPTALFRDSSENQP